MADVVSRDVRSRMMSGIRGKNTKPELLIRRGLHAKGFRYLLHDRRLPGKPDLVFPKHRAVIFVHGCFWHGHDCHLFKWPKTRKGFWRNKIDRNKWLDEQAILELRKSGWRVGIVWECTVKGRTRLLDERTIMLCAKWLRSNRKALVLLGTDGRTHRV
jgi:DNA mismatch endonuclease (patch repair protein)